MASLNFKGKTAVWNHHLSVPYHTLDKDKKSSLTGAGESENMIIEGDNLLALKALLPKYQGKVKCIYIDPPNHKLDGQYGSCSSRYILDSLFSFCTMQPR